MTVEVHAPCRQSFDQQLALKLLERRVVKRQDSRNGQITDRKFGQAARPSHNSQQRIAIEGWLQTRRGLRIGDVAGDVGESVEHQCPAEVIHQQFPGQPCQGRLIRVEAQFQVDRLMQRAGVMEDGGRQLAGVACGETLVQLLAGGLQCWRGRGSLFKLGHCIVKRRGR